MGCAYVVPNNALEDVIKLGSAGLDHECAKSDDEGSESENESKV